MAQPTKSPGIMASVISGIGGMIRGGLGSAVLGGLLTAVAASAVVLITNDAASLSGIVSSAFPALATQAPTLGAAAAIGYTSLAGAITLGAIGTALGGIAGVVESRQAPLPSSEAEKMAFAQGVAVGHALEEQQQQLQQQPQSSKFRQMVGKTEKLESYREMVEQQAAEAIKNPGKFH